MKCPVGEADIVSDIELIEIKLWNEWKKAVGQLMIYQYYFKDKKLRIHFFGPKPKDKLQSEIKNILTSLDIKMTIEQDIIKHNDIDITESKSEV